MGVTHTSHGYYSAMLLHPLVLLASLGASAMAMPAHGDPPCHWSWRHLRCEPSCTATANQPSHCQALRSGRCWVCRQRCSPKLPDAPKSAWVTGLPDVYFYLALASALALAIEALVLILHPAPAAPGLLRTLFRLVFCRGLRLRGAMSGIRFPTCVQDLTGNGGPQLLTEMLRHGGHIPDGISVNSVQNLGKNIADGVKGDKALLKIEYVGTFGEVSIQLLAQLPRRLFVKFNLRRLSAMRLLVEVREVAKCEASFYARLAEHVGVATPKCYFVDYNETSGEFCLLSEALRFGEGGISPLKHRVRDSPTLEEQRLFARVGAEIQSRFWGADAARLGVPRFEETHRRLWRLVQLVGALGLRQTARRSFRGKRGVNDGFMTWRPPAELLGRELELIRDMPELMRSLCTSDGARASASGDSGLLAFGHNDLLTDNAYYWRDSTSGHLRMGLFDWQQSCINNVGQEWAWNLHWLEPAFLDQHEDELIQVILSTYAQNGLRVDRGAFLRAYTLGTAQMYVWGGGGLQTIMSTLHRKGLFESLLPNDPRCADGSLEGDLLEIVVGAEMTRRTFTNCCNIMRRHDFVGLWRQWQLEKEGSRHV